jgi:hypothetical protein
VYSIPYSHFEQPQLSNVLSPILEIQHAIDFEQPPKLSNVLSLVLEIQHVISLKQSAELPESLPLHDKKDRDNPNSLGCVQFISIQDSKGVYSIPYFPSYKVYGHKPRMIVDFLLSSPHSKMFYLAEYFAFRDYNLHFEIIKHIQVSNEQYKFRDNLHKYHDAFNVEDYFVIHIRLERCPLKTNHKLQVSSARSFEVLLMI